MIPAPWQFALLALAAYRFTRLIGWDVITRPAREAVIGRYEEGSGKKARDTERGRKLGSYRRKLDEFVHCPFCLGFWVSLSVWGAWSWQPHWMLVVCIPFALNAVVGLVTRTLDA